MVSRRPARQLQKGSYLMNAFMIIVATLMAMSILPHILRMIKTKASRDQSLIGVCGIALGMICWIGYGIAVGDITIIVANIIMLSFQLAYTSTVIYYRINQCPMRKNN